MAKNKHEGGRLDVTVTCGELRRALAIAAHGVASGRTALEILRSCHLTATPAGFLFLGATNLDVAWSSMALAGVTMPGQAVVPHRWLAEAVKRLDDDLPVRLAMAPDGKRLTVSGGVGVLEIPTFAVVDFPIIRSLCWRDGNCGKPGAPRTEWIDGEEFGRAAARAAFAAARDDARPVQTRVHFRGNDCGDTVKLMASDGFRLTTVEAAVSGDRLEGELACSFPAVHLATAAELAGGDRVALSVAPDGKSVELWGNRWAVVAREMEDSSPDYERVIPTVSVADLTVETKALRAAVQAAKPIAALGANVLRFVPDGEGFTVWADAAEGPRFRVHVPAAVEGEPCEFALNSAYLIDYLASPVNGRTTIRLQSPSSPVLLLQPDDPTYRYIVMPMHIAR